MLEFLVIRLESQASGGAAPVQWMGLDAAGTVVDSGECELPELGRYCADWPAAPRIVALAPARQVLLSSAHVPAGQQRYVKQALPFLIEEKLAEDIEDVHIAMGPVAREQPVPVAVVRHLEIIAWLDALYTAGLPPASLIPEPLALPWREGQISVAIAGDCCLIRAGQWRGLGCDRDNVLTALWALARQCQDDGGAPPAIAIYCPEEEEPAAWGRCLQQQLAAADYAGEVALHEREGGPLAVLGPQLVGEAPADRIDLLQGGYGSDRSAGARRFNWRRIGLTFAACVAAHVAVTTAAGLWWQWRAQAVRADTVAQYQQWFPAARRVFDPRRQLQSQLNSSRGADSAVLLAYIGGLAGSWGTGGEALRLRSLSYRGDTASLTLEVDGASAADLDELRQRLAKQGVRGELKAVSGRDDKVSGRLELAGVH